VQAWFLLAVRSPANIRETVGGARPLAFGHNQGMSHKRYQFKLIEAANAAELETRLKEAGGQQWSAVGYGVLPDGSRSVLMERKVRIHTQRHRDRHEREVATDA
jgi:hypothetical protein